MRDFLFRLADGFRRLRREEEGVIIACSLAVFLFLYVLGCGVYALGTTIYEREALQNAADAAAYSAASIQADALSRMAMLNKALAYTYIQMSRKQMDCITARWLKLVHDRYMRDRQWAKDWMGVLFVPKGPLPVDPWSLAYTIVDWTAANVVKGTRVKASSCSILRHADDNGWGWICGSRGQPDVLKINGNDVAWATIKKVAGDAGFMAWIAQLETWIETDRATIDLINHSYATVHKEMCDSIEKSVGAVLLRSLTAAFGEGAMEETYYSMKVPTESWDPYHLLYTSSTSDDDAGKLSGHAGYFRGMQNVENDERRFLAMAVPMSASWTLPDYFLSSEAREKRNSKSGGGMLSTLTGKSDEPLTAGIDQWFVRGRREGDRYLREDGGIGFRRVFWDTNTEVRKEGLFGKATRGNHMLGGRVSFGNGLVNALLGPIVNGLIEMVDVSPSVCNRKGSAKKEDENLVACEMISNSMALYAEYEWASAKWFCYGLKRKRWWKHFKCRGHHLAIPKFYCGISNIEKELNDSVWDTEQYDDDEEGEVDEEADKKKEEELRKEQEKNDSSSDSVASDDSEGSEDEATDESDDEEEEEDEEDGSIYADDEEPPTQEQIEEYAKNERGKEPKEADRILSTWTDVCQLPLDMSYGLISGKAKSKAGRHVFDMLGVVKIGSGKKGDHHGYADWETNKAFSRGNGGTLITEVVSSLGKQLKMNLRESAISRSKYRSCAMGVYTDLQSENQLWLRGFARIYGDDAKICKASVYEGANPRPWILSERFFGPDGTITVAVAKRRKNPWAQLMGAAAESLRSLYSLGNPGGERGSADGTLMWALSSGRAAFRDPVDGSLQGSYRYLNPEGGNDALGAHEPGESGCVCDTAPGRLERQWNLCVTEWEPTLVPVVMADTFRAVEDRFVVNPQQETSGLAKLLYLDFGGSGNIQTGTNDAFGWLPLSGAGAPKESDEFLRVVAPGAGDGSTFGPADGKDWPATLRKPKVL